MSTILLALALAVQTTTPPQQQPRPLPSGDPPGRSLTPAHDLFFEDLPRPTREARRAIHSFGSCAADRSPQLAAEMLGRDFTTHSYRAAIRRLSRSNEGCFRQRGRMESSGLLFAGAVAETLLERDSQPLNARLARAALQPAIPARSPSDAVAICVVRSVPDQIAQLLASEPASDSEAEAARALRPVVELCARPARRPQITDAGLRAIISTAAFRSLSNAAPVNVAGTE